MILLPLLLTAASAAPVREAVPIDPASWVSSTDYPAKAVVDKTQGKVSFRLAVNTDGRASACGILTSSGSQELDTATCELMVEHARFTPAIGADGRPTSAEYSSAVNWVLPDTSAMAINAQIPHPTDGEHRVVFDMQSSGSFCYLRDNETSKLLKPTFCEDLAKALTKAGVGMDGVIYTQLPNPIPYAPAS